MILVDIWKRHRKIIQPTFNQKILNSFIPIFNSKADILADEIFSKYVDKGNFETFDLFSRFTLDNVCGKKKYVLIFLIIVTSFLETLMGTEMNAQGGDDDYITPLGR